MPLAQQPDRIINSLYRLGPALISGTVATLFSATYLATNDPVALLLVRPPARGDHAEAQRLLQSARTLITLLHPHLLHLHEAGIHQEDYFLITDLRGRPLRELLNQEALPLERALEITRQLTQGIAALHSRQIIGLDLRPERLYIETAERYDTALVADIGLRLFLQSLGFEEQESAGAPLLQIDPRYAAPEQLQPGTISPATDVYTLGLVLFEMIAGRVPFVGRSAADTRLLQLSQPVPNLRPLRGEALPELQSLIEQALSKHPSLRFPDMPSFGAALESLQERLPKRGPSAGRMAPIYTFRTAPLEIIKGAPASAQPARSQPPSATQAPAVIAPDEDITLPKDDEQASQTLRIPGRARLLLGKSERKKVIPIARFPAILGRADPRRQQKPDIDLAPYDTKRSISRLHARIWYEGGFFYIEDLGSVNKTVLGELELTPYERQLLRRHDSIKLGLLQIIFEY
jgi:serine/threonine-protein kinase